MGKNAETEYADSWEDLCKADVGSLTQFMYRRQNNCINEKEEDVQISSSPEWKKGRGGNACYSKCNAIKPT